MSDTNLRCWRQPKHYQAKNAHIFASMGSLQWYCREHREALVRAGAMVIHGGRWYIDEQKFDAYVQKAAQEGAELKLARVPA